MYGGRWVMPLNTGTNSRAPRPRANTSLRSKGVVGSRRSASLSSSSGRSNSPRMVRLSASSGTSRQTRLGRKSALMMPVALIWWPIHSMVVVTSPIGDQAPPALAAMTTIPAKNQRSRWSPISLRNSEIITMVVVRLSSTAERKKVMKPISHSSVTRLWVRMRSVITLKPSWASISSTMVMAPSRKNRISAISPR